MENQVLSHQQLHAIQSEIIERIIQLEGRLTLIREEEIPLIEKWQRILFFLLPIQAQVLKKYALGNNQEALNSFNTQYMEEAARSHVLSDLNKKKWLIIFETAFGFSEFKETTLSETQSIIRDIVSEMTSETFLKKVDDVMANLKPGATILNKRDAIFSVLYPLHRSVMVQHGFDGEFGYIQAQRGIFDYSYDPEIIEKSSYAQAVLFERAKLQ